jgi:hypothetical protein
LGFNAAAIWGHILHIGPHTRLKNAAQREYEELEIFLDYYRLMEIVEAVRGLADHCLKERVEKTIGIVLRTLELFG